jgi:hypothetical protein
VQQNAKYFNAADGSANYQGINAYNNSGWKYIASGTAQYLQQFNGGFTFFNAASGTAGAAITWATLLTIASTGSATFSSSVVSTGTFSADKIGGNIRVAGTTAGGIFTSGSLMYFSDWDVANKGLYVNLTTGITTIMTLGSGTVTATSGVLSAVSDMNLKIEDGFINNALDKVMNLKPRYYHWKKESGLPTDLRQLGFYAQEVNQALGEEAANTPKTENDKWGIYDRGMIAFLTAAIQELKAEIDTLKNK